MGKLIQVVGPDFTNCGLGTVSAGSPSSTRWYIDFGSTLSNMTAQASLSVAPFAYHKVVYDSMLIGKPINLFKFNVLTAGTFTIYKVTSYGTTNTLTALQTFTISSTGIQTIQLNTPVTLAANEALAFCSSSNTCKMGYSDAEYGIVYPDDAARGFKYSDGSTPFGYNNGVGAVLGINIGYVG